MEKRKALRFDLKLPFKLVGRGDEDLRTNGETENLSYIGVLFQTEANLRIGEAVEYIITLPAFPGSNREVNLHCFGRVVRRAGDAKIAATMDRYEFERGAGRC